MADPAVGEGAHEALNRAYRHPDDAVRVTTTTPTTETRSISEKYGVWRRVSDTVALRVRRV